MAKRSKCDLLKILGPAIAIPALAVGAAVGISGPGAALRAGAQIHDGIAIVAMAGAPRNTSWGGPSAGPECTNYLFNGCNTVG